MDRLKGMMSGGSSELDSTISALQGGLTSLNPAAAIGSIDGWQQKLSGLGLTDIVSDLGELKNMLTSGTFDAKAIGALLVRLGEKTSATTGQAPLADIPKLQQLATMLSSVGRTLS